MSALNRSLRDEGRTGKSDEVGIAHELGFAAFLAKIGLHDRGSAVRRGIRGRCQVVHAMVNASISTCQYVKARDMSNTSASL